MPVIQHRVDAATQARTPQTLGTLTFAALALRSTTEIARS
jgi:hypothetical protein